MENLIEFVHLNPSDNIFQNINKWWTCYLDTGKQNNVPELSRVLCYQIKHDPIDSSEIDNSTRIKSPRQSPWNLKIKPIRTCETHRSVPKQEIYYVAVKFMICFYNEDVLQCYYVICN